MQSNKRNATGENESSDHIGDSAKGKNKRARVEGAQGARGEQSAKRAKAIRTGFDSAGSESGNESVGLDDRKSTAKSLKKSSAGTAMTAAAAREDRSGDGMIDKSLMTFPERLMNLFQNGTAKNAMWWLGEGDAFCIVPKLFSEQVLDKYFQGTKFESFTRKLNRWGFKRVSGRKVPANTVAYQHGMFVKANPEMVKKMTGGKKKEQQPEPNEHGRGAFPQQALGAELQESRRAAVTAASPLAMSYQIAPPSLYSPAHAGRQLGVSTRLAQSGQGAAVLGSAGIGAFTCGTGDFRVPGFGVSGLESSVFAAAGLRSAGFSPVGVSAASLGSGSTFLHGELTSNHQMISRAMMAMEERQFQSICFEAERSRQLQVQQLMAAEQAMLARQHLQQQERDAELLSELRMQQLLEYGVGAPGLQSYPRLAHHDIASRALLSSAAVSSPLDSQSEAPAAGAPPLERGVIDSRLVELYLLEQQRQQQRGPGRLFPGSGPGPM